jgi:hypothetical protein
MKLCALKILAGSEQLNKIQNIDFTRVIINIYVHTKHNNDDVAHETKAWCFKKAIHLNKYL